MPENPPTKEPIEYPLGDPEEETDDLVHAVPYLQSLGFDHKQIVDIVLTALVNDAALPVSILQEAAESIGFAAPSSSVFIES